MGMKLLDSQLDEKSLYALGEEACSLLMEFDFSALANRFGYMRAFDREPAAALEADFLLAKASPWKGVADGVPKIVVKYFQQNDIVLH